MSILPSGIVTVNALSSNLDTCCPPRYQPLMARLALTLACGDYEILRALKEGTVTPDGIDLTILTAMDSATRHWRFLRNREFDVAEVSASSYIAARAADAPFRAIPVFPHRRFRHGFIYINTQAGIRAPADLIGRRIGVKSFLTTATVWQRGILEHEHAVPHDQIKWFTELDEDIAFTPPPTLRLHRIPEDRTLESLLLAHELDAVLHPDLIQPILDRDPRVARLFPDYREQEIAYFRRTGVFPIMHVIGLRQDLVDRHPWIAINLHDAFEQSKSLAMHRMQDPRLVPLAWYRDAWENQDSILGRDPWSYGLTPQNRHNLETLVGYSQEQGLIARRIPLEQLFLDVSPGRKRGRRSF